MLQFNSAALSLVGLALVRKSPKWLVLPIAVQGFFLQHGIQGWCPPLPLFRRAGIRTAREIEIERHALKALRGDYEQAAKEDASRAFKAAATNGTDNASSNGGLIAPTLTRVPQNTESALNESIDRDAEQRVASVGTRPEAREARLKELQGEWDIERTIEVEAPSMSLAGLVLGATVSRKWLVLPVIAQSMMLLHSLQGFYPLLPLFRRLGLRTEGEIARERYAIKALRGDFDQASREEPATVQGSANAAFEAAERTA